MDYPKDYPQAPTGSSLDLVFRAMYEHGYEFQDGHDWQCPVHSDQIASCGIHAGSERNSPYPVLVSCQKCITRLGSREWFAAFAAALGIESSILSLEANPDNPSRLLNPGERQSIGASKHARAREGKLEAEYTYQLVDGVAVLKVQRYVQPDGHKFFKQMRGDGFGGFAYGLSETQVRPPFQLPLLHDVYELQPDTVLHITEGEKSVLAILKANALATCFAGGSNAKDEWIAEGVAMMPPFEYVKIIADNDEPGREFAARVRRVVRSLRPGTKINIVRSATEGKGDDVVEHLAAGHSLEDLVRVRVNDQTVREPPVEPEVSEPVKPSAPEHHWPSPKQPLRIARRHLHESYRQPTGTRLLQHWNDEFYEWDESLSKYTARDDNGVNAELYRALDTHQYLSKDLELLPYETNRSLVANVRDGLAAECYLNPSSYEDGSWLDGRENDFSLVHFRNGHLDPVSKQLHSPTPLMFNRYAVPFDYVDDAPEPEKWKAFLCEVFPDKASRMLLQEWFGYLLSGDTSMQKMLLIIGPTRSGKGVILRTIRNLLGADNCVMPQLQTLNDRFWGESFIGRSVGLFSDARFGGRAESMATVVERLLTLSGGDPLTIERKNKTSWHGMLPTRMTFAANETPKLLDASNALSERFIALKMDQSFLGRENTHLEEGFVAEYAGIIRWALGGLNRLRRNGRFTVPGASQVVKDELLTLSSPERAFITENFTVEPFKGAVSKDELWESWSVWSGRRGYFSRDMGTFFRSVYAAFPDLKPDRKMVNGERTQLVVGLTPLAARGGLAVTRGE